MSESTAYVVVTMLVASASYQRVKKQGHSCNFHLESRIVR